MVYKKSILFAVIVGLMVFFLSFQFAGAAGLATEKLSFTNGKANAMNAFNIQWDKKSELFAPTHLLSKAVSFHSIIPVDVWVVVQQSSNENLLDSYMQAYRQGSNKVRVLIVLLTYLVASFFILFIAIIINRRMKSSQRRKTERIKKDYQEKLATFLYDENMSDFDVEGLKKKLNRDILTDEIRELHRNIHGESATRLRDLYFNLDLHKDSLKRVRGNKWFEISKGMKELAQMDVKDANDRIASLVDHKNPVLRMEAQVALVKLSELDPLGFLDNLQSELSYWEQVNIHDTLNYHQIVIDSFEPWLDKDNTSVVVFALRMIGEFKHIGSANAVKELLEHDDENVRLQAVETLKELETTDFVAEMKELYEKETRRLYGILQENREKPTDKDIQSLEDLPTRKIRYAIVSAFQSMATPNDLNFLSDVATDYENSFRIRMKALRIMYEIKPQGEQLLDEMLKDSDELLQTMIINVKQNTES